MLTNYVTDSPKNDIDSPDVQILEQGDDDCEMIVDGQIVKI